MPRIDVRMRVRSHILIRTLAEQDDLFTIADKIKEYPEVDGWIRRNTDGFFEVAATALANYVEVADDREGYIRVIDQQCEFEPDILLYASREAQRSQRKRAERLAASAAKRLKTFWIKDY